MADSKLAALQATAAAPFTTTLERVRPHPYGLRAVLTLTALLPLAGFAAARFLPAPAER
jgi:hypothetical protein